MDYSSTGFEATAMRIVQLESPSPWLSNGYTSGKPEIYFKPALKYFSANSSHAPEEHKSQWTGPKARCMKRNREKVQHSFVEQICRTRA